MTTELPAWVADVIGIDMRDSFTEMERKILECRHTKLHTHAQMEIDTFSEMEIDRQLRLLLHSQMVWTADFAHGLPHKMDVMNEGKVIVLCKCELAEPNRWDLYGYDIVYDKDRSVFVLTQHAINFDHPHNK